MEKKSVCTVCPHHCVLAEGMTGRCRARGRRGGRVESLSYGRVASAALDPVEKKPFARWHPGARILSVGTFGCNLACPFCQNAAISQADEAAETALLSPEALTALAKELVPRGNIGAAFTYNEPLVGWEYVRDAARLLRAEGLCCALVTNGTAEPWVLEELLPWVDAMNIDLKGWRASFYEWLGGDLETVKRTIARAARSCHVEVTTLVVPGRNDSPRDMDAQAAWLASISDELPLHISRYFPRFQMTEPPTSAWTIEALCRAARRHLRYVFPGNC